MFWSIKAFSLFFIFSRFFLFGYIIPLGNNILIKEYRHFYPPIYAIPCIEILNDVPIGGLSLQFMKKKVPFGKKAAAKPPSAVCRWINLEKTSNFKKKSTSIAPPSQKLRDVGVCKHGTSFFAERMDEGSDFLSTVLKIFENTIKTTGHTTPSHFSAPSYALSKFLVMLYNNERRQRGIVIRLMRT